MATVTWERNQGSIGTPSWVSNGANTLVFSGSATGITSVINTTAWQDGTHIGNGDPGTDQCGGGPNSSHMNNVKFVASGTCSINGGATENINDTNLAEAECTLRIHLNNGVAVQTQNSMLFSFNASSDTVEAVEVECYAFERGVTATAWTQINDDSANIGGDNSGERLDLGEKSSAADHFWYLALSARGETAGGKTAFDLKFRTEIF